MVKFQSFSNEAEGLRADVYQDVVSGYVVTLTDTDAGRTLPTSVKFTLGQLAEAVAYAKRLVSE